jgi:Flp pilus assembly protein TadD
MDRVEKTVFVSYRRASSALWALAISQHLTHRGYDVFFDYQTLASGDFEGVIIENIRARAHFLVLLTPSALERVGEPGDWLRREIEAALEHRRNIVPLMLEGFDFATPSIGTHLTGTLAPLKSYNGLSVPLEYFDAAMNRLMTRHLNVALTQVRHPASQVASEAAKTQQVAAEAAPPVTVEELTAERWFERAFDAADIVTKIAFYTEAIRLKPDYYGAFNNRGLARHDKGDLDGALADFTEATRLKPDYYGEFNNRGLARHNKGDLDGALADFTKAIRLKPDPASAFYNRGNVRRDKGDLDGALADYDEAIRLKPDYADAHHDRGNARRRKGDYSGAIADYQKYLDLGGAESDGGQTEVEEVIRQLQEQQRLAT